VILYDYQENEALEVYGITEKIIRTSTNKVIIPHHVFDKEIYDVSVYIKQGEWEL